ncbi:uncharacterized protein JCM10292_004485 [Rhodotorula paludigena]|uniref:uncharacterized protein n=1 Tax=Rhodotorula paludigena TaxID=86838 RepID=UPI00317BE22E
MASQRNLTLAFSTLAALSAGTNYAVGAYLPQVGQRLHLGSLAMNVVAASGNAGVYLSGPVLGAMVDRRGSKVVLLVAGGCLLAGYLGLTALYAGGEDGVFAVLGMPALALCQLCTGVGSSAGISAALKATSQSFAKASRGFAMAIVLSGFGLSAFFYAAISRANLLPSLDPTTAFLLLLALGTGTSMLLASLFVRPPPPTSGVGPDSLTPYQPLSTADDRLTSRSRSRSHSRSRSSSPPRRDFAQEHPPSEYSFDDLGAERPGYLRRRSATPLLDDDFDKDGHVPHSAGDLNVSGWDLLRERDFWGLWCFLGLCSGIGLMYINNLGTIALTLSPPETDPSQVALVQSRLVSLLSIFNCLGRLAIGLTADFFTHHAPVCRFARIWWLVATAGLFVASQVLAGQAERVDGFGGLTLPTMMVGTAYGTLFGAVPVVCLERFGMRDFSANNGFLTLSPAVFANLTNMLFGAIYDSHVSAPESAPPPSSASEAGRLLRRGGGAARDPAHLCTLGRECFATAFRTTTLMSVAAVALAIVLSLRRTFKPVYHS